MQATLDRPELARRYLRHALGDVPPDPAGIDVDLVGRLKLGETWYDFESTLEVDRLSGFRWNARVHRGGIRFSGHDEYRNRHGEMLWRLYGLFPVVRDDSADVTESGRGRAALEQVFLPSALARPEVTWSMAEPGWARASWELDGEDVALDYQIAEDGRLKALRTQRWSDAEGMPWHYVTFGGDIYEEARFAGMMLPSRLTAGWFYGEPRWSEGRFFEGEVTGARIRS
jgi:hypothetical protein